MGAQRLPGKMLLDLHGYPVIEWVFKRVSAAGKLNEVVFALPGTTQNDVLAEYLLDIGATVFRGSETDVLDRFYQAAKTYNAGQVVRICADNPFVSATEIDKLVVHFSNVKCDYAYNHIPRDNLYPDGLGAEITTIENLEHLNTVATSKDHREHIFNYIWDNKDRFKISTFDPDDEGLLHPELKLDLDTSEDLHRLLQLEVNPDMSASQIVKATLKAWN